MSEWVKLVDACIRHNLREIAKASGAALESDYYNDEMAACDHLQHYMRYDLFLQWDRPGPLPNRRYCPGCGCTYGWQE